jgi:outer membrane protein OmpA-like peptidoglycan-associated protein
VSHSTRKRIGIAFFSFAILGLVVACGGAPGAGAKAPGASGASGAPGDKKGGPPLSAAFDNPGGSAGAGATGATGSGAAGSPVAALGKPCPADKTQKDLDSPLGSPNPIPFALKGKLVYLPEDAAKLPDFSKLPSKGTLYATKLDVPERDFKKGFPGVSNRFEWFALDYKGSFSAPVAGDYGFSLESDDGSKLLIDGKLVIDNDGQHSTEEAEGKATLAAGPHAIEVQYFQGPRYGIALMLQWKPPGQKDFIVFQAGKAAPAEIKERGGAVRITLSSDVLFDTAKYDLKPPALAALEAAKETAIDPRPTSHITVEGHTDDRGSDAYNQKLSEQRAHSVAAWLTAHGVAAARITTRGYGEKAPRVPNTSEGNRHKNRRVEMVVVGCPGK